jgi:RHS repeat-associated protein
MNLRLSCFWRPIISLFCAHLLCAVTARAVNHNPTEQTSNVTSTDVTLENPTFTYSGSSYTATVTINPGQHAELLQYGSPFTVRVLDENGTEIASQNWSYNTSYTVRFNNLDVAQISSCKVKFDMGGLTGGTATSSAATLSAPPPDSVNSVNSYYDLGRTSWGGSAGRLSIYSDNPTASLYTPAGLTLITTDNSVEVINGGSPAQVRQVLSATQLTDVVVLNAESYEIRFYTASQKGSKVDGLYQPTGSPFKVAKIENPGITPIAGTEDDDLYADSRWGRSFAYALPVSDGPYKVRLHFAELYHDAVAAAAFNVKAEDQAVLSNYDVFAASGSKNTARIEEIATTVCDGELNLDFASVTYGAQLAALEVVRDGAVAIAGTVDTALYQSERTGDFSYAFTLPNGIYSIVLHFSESTYAASGKRVFNVTAEGSTVLLNYDIYAQAGAANTAHTETLAVTLTDGQLNLGFSGVTGQASLSAITVINTTTSSVVASINVGGSAYTAADSTVYAADTGYTGGEARKPGQLIHAINAGGESYTTALGVAYTADHDYVSGTSYNGALNRVRVTRSEGSESLVYDYAWITDPRTGRFTETVLTHPGGLKKEGKSVVLSQDEQIRTETRTWRDALDNLVSKTTTQYEKFPFGVRKVSEVIDPDGAALVTTWTYIEGTSNPDDPKPDGYGLEKSMTRYDGYWEDYAYDSERRLIKTVSRYLDSATHNESANRVDTIAYATTNPVHTRITTIAGQEVSRTYEVEIDDELNHEFERQTITAITPGAAWDASDNLVSKTRTYKSSHPTGVLRGQTKWTSRSDGTMILYGYSFGSGTRTVTTDTGAPNPEMTAIIAGTRTVAIYNDASQQIEEAVVDIATGLTLSGWEALTVDTLGRPTLAGYGDGSTREITYVGSAASCGSCSGSGNFLIESETDRNGVTTTYAYDALNRRTDTTRRGVTEHVVYDAADRVLERHRIGTDSSDIRLSKNVYDLAGRVIETYDALNNKTDYAYTYPTGGGLVTTITNPAATSGAPRGTRLETTYGDGRIKEISGTAVSPMKYAYGTWNVTDQAGEWTREIKVGDASAETEWTKTYTDLAHSTVKQEYPAPGGTVVATMSYNTLGQLEKQTDPDGVQTLFAYNTKGEREVTAVDLDQDGVIDYTGTDRITKTVRDVYSRSGTIVGRSTTQVWATDGSNTTTTVSVSEQDGYGNASWQTDAAGAESSTAIARTAPGAWTVTAIRPDGSRQVQTYTSGRLASTATLSSSLSAIGSVSYAYDAHNRVETQSDARTGDTDYTYTERDEVLTVTANNGTETTTYDYDALGNQLTITRPDSSVTTNEYHLRNKQLKKTSGSQTYPVEYTYGLQGRMKTLTTWQNATSSTGAAVTTWNYDAQRGWLTQKLYADSTGPAYTYTDAGRLLTRTWARSSSLPAPGSPLVTTYGYNNAGDLATTDYSDATPDVAITYTRFGAQHTVTDATGTRTFTYTAALRPDQERLPSFYGDRILTRSYQVGLDLASTPSSVPGRNDGFELGVSGDLDQDYDVVYGYDTSGRLGTVTDPNGTYTYGYVTNSNLRHTVTGPVHVATTTYESYRNVIDTVENKVGGTTVSKFDYTVNNLGQRTQRANTGTAFGTTSTDVFTYNTKGEVESVTNATLTARDQSFAYDDIGNRLTFTTTGGAINYTANTLNQYTAIGSNSPTYDEDGNQTSAPAGTSSSTSPLNYIWDAENRLVLIEPIVPTTGDEKQLNVYDAQSRRVRKQVSTYASGAWSLTTDEKFVYDRWNLVATLLWNPSTSTFDLNSTYTWGTDLSGSMQDAGGVGGLLSAKDGGSVYHYTYDANGNVSEVLNSSGGIAAHYEYNAFGSTVSSSGAYATANAYRFSTKPMDSVGDLYYYGLRYYDPKAGRWVARDPIGEAGSKNLMAFIENRPITSIDLLGATTFSQPVTLSWFDTIDATGGSTATINVEYDCSITNGVPAISNVRFASGVPTSLTPSGINTTYLKVSMAAGVYYSLSNITSGANNSSTEAAMTADVNAHDVYGTATLSIKIPDIEIGGVKITNPINNLIPTVGTLSAPIVDTRKLKMKCKCGIVGSASVE